MTRRVLLALLGMLLTIGVAGADDLARELPRIPPRAPDDALQAFAIHHGFRLQAVAVEPLVTDPVSVCYDADGRLYAVEMRGYPYPEKSPSGHVRLLEDRDGDGVFDKSTIFLDGLSWPTGVVPYEGGVFIAVAPDILYAKDTDGDGVADIKKVMFSGFGTQNVQALLNGLLWGPDGWIYGVSGGNGGEIQNRAVPGRKPVSVRGRDFRFQPDGTVFEAISGGGQFGHAFDDWGHRFTCNNSNHMRQIVLPAAYLERNPAFVPAAVIDDIAAEGPAAPVFRISPPEPWRVVRTRQRAADPAYRKRLPPTELVATGFFTSATGVTIYRGSAYPSEYHGNAFIGDVGGNLVHRKVLTRNGPTFLATRADQGVEFLASKDNWFRPVNFANTPNGTLLIVDMYRETIEHPLSIPEPIKQHLDLTSGKDRGRLYELLPDGFKPRARPALSKASTAVLVQTLADPDAWWRETAQRLLIERRDPTSLPFLKKMAQERPTALGRVHALWTLDVLGGLEAEDLRAPMNDPEPGVREQAARLAEQFGPQIEYPVWKKLANDPDPMVRFQVALSAGALESGTAGNVLLVLAQSDAGNRWTRQAIMSSLQGFDLGMLLFMLGRTPHFLDKPPGNVWLEELSILIGARNNPHEVQSLLNLFTQPDANRGDQRLNAVLLGLGRGLQRSGGSLRGMLQGPGAVQFTQLFLKAAGTAHDNGGPLASRLDAIRLLGLGPTALGHLPSLLDARQPSAVQLAVLQALTGLTDPRVGPEVLAHWKALSPSVRREAVEVLFARPDRLNALLDAVEAKSVAATDIEPARRKLLLAHADKTLRARAAKLFAGDPSADRARVIAAYRKALELSGARDKGRAVFVKTCATCHKAEGQGTDVGPSLATITGRTAEDLLVHILDPNREVPPPYVNYSVATTDGRVLTGMIAEESANAVTLKRAEGATDVVPRGRIEAISSTGLSLMPEGLEKGLGPQDFADLIAYLKGLQAGGAPGR